MRRFVGVLCVSLGLFASPLVSQPGQAQIYSEAELKKDAVRLRNAVIKIYELGLKPALTDKERLAIGNFEFAFPLPGKKDPLLNFAATTDGRYVIMPLMSLKALEDLTLAYAWLYHNNYSLSTIDLYFAMIRYKQADDFPGGAKPTILEALGVPPDAYKTSKPVDDLSLRLRNEAFAFVIAHEIGHIRHRHKPIKDISARQAQRDEIESDRFALELFRRTKTGALGPVIFFQAQVYSMLHRYQFESKDDWRKHITSFMTHPISTERLKDVAEFLKGPLADARPAERATWIWIGRMMDPVIRTLEDVELGRCIARVAMDADPAILKPRRNVAFKEMMRRCRPS